MNWPVCKPACSFANGPTLRLVGPFANGTLVTAPARLQMGNVLCGTPSRSFTESHEQGGAARFQPVCARRVAKWAPSSDGDFRYGWIPVPVIYVDTWRLLYYLPTTGRQVWGLGRGTTQHTAQAQHLLFGDASHISSCTISAGALRHCTRGVLGCETPTHLITATTAERRSQKTASGQTARMLSRLGALRLLQPRNA